MNLSRYQTIPSQAEITSKGKPDFNEIARRKMTANEPTSYPGAHSDTMFAIMPGEICMGRRDRKAEKSYDGDYMELCLSTTAGLDTAVGTERLERDHYFVGIAKDVDLGPDRDFFGDGSMEHGFAAIRHGSVTTMNNNSTGQEIYAGDLVAVSLGKMNKSQSELGRHHIDTGRTSFQQNAGSCPVNKPLWETVPFNPNDFAVQRAGLQLAILQLKGKNIADYEADGRKSLCTLEEEAGALALGVLRLASQFDGAIVIGQQFSEENLETLKQAFRNDKWFDDMVRAVTGVYHSKASRIIGTALNGAKVGGQLNMALGQGRTGF